MTFSLNYIINIKSSVIIFLIFIIIGYCDKYFNYYEPQMNGQSSITMKPLVQQYRKFIEQNQDLGSSFAVYNNTTAVLDLISGYEDLEFKQKWTKNTISQLFSLSNVVGTISVALLVDRGLITYEDKLSKYMDNCHPSLANKTISEVMMHKAGIPYLKNPVSITDYRDDSDILFKMLLSQDPIESDPPIFHKYTQSLLLDAIIRQVDPLHRSLSYFFMEEIAYKHKVDIFIGLPRTQLYRTARIYQPTMRHYMYALGRFDFSSMLRYFLKPSDTTNKVESTFTDLKNTVTRDSDILEIAFSSWNVFSNADSLTKMFSEILFGSFNKKAVLKPSTINQLCENSSEHYSDVIGSYISFTKGGLMTFPGPKNSQLCGWRDSTGQFLLADLKRNLTLGYVTNHLHALSLDKDYIFSYIIKSLYDTF